jgi:hypothetical protein
MGDGGVLYRAVLDQSSLVPALAKEAALERSSRFEL